MAIVLYILFVLISLILILLVMLQDDQGEGLGGIFGAARPRPSVRVRATCSPG